MAHKIMIYDVIGWNVMARDVVNELDRIASEEDDKDVALHINSGGGFVHDAVAIYNRLKMHPGKVTVHIDGLAASAATIVMMGGETIRSPEAAIFMVHKPWSWAIGDADDMRKSADVLDITEGSMLSMYAKKTGMSTDEIAELLKEETWMTAEDALAFGFIDAVVDLDEEEDGDESEDVEETDEDEEDDRVASRIRQAFQSYHEAQQKNDNLPVYDRVAAGTHHKGAFGGITNKSNEVPEMAKDPKTKSPGAPSDDNKNDNTKDISQAAAQERNRIMAITSLCAVHAIEEATRDEYIENETSLEEVRAQVLDTIAERNSGKTGSGLNPSAADVSVGETEEQKWSEGVRLALEARAGMLEGDEAREARRNNQFTSMTLAEMCMKFAGERKGLSRDETIGRVLASAHGIRPTMAASGTHTTSDFPSVLSNIASKSLLLGYSAQRETWSAWTNRGELSDYKIAKRVGVDMASNLLKVEEGAQYEAGTIDDRGIDISLGKYGRMLQITREAILNDDLSQMTEIPRKMGAAAQRLVGNLVYQVLTDNSFQGGSLFAGAHNNTHAVALDESGLQTLLTAMMTLEDPNAKGSTLGIEPRFLLVPAALNLDARKIVNAAINASGATNVQQNIVEVITEGRLDLDDPTNWYVTADPMATDTVEVAFLNGNEVPFIEQIAMPTVDGVTFKVRHEVGVAARARQGMQRSTGA